MIAKYYDGFAQNGLSRQYFKDGVYLVYPHYMQHQQQAAIDSLLDVLYEKARCGLYNGGMTGSSILLTSTTTDALAFNYQTRNIIVNPHILVSDLRQHLSDYIQQLTVVTNTQLRQNFERRFDFD